MRAHQTSRWLIFALLILGVGALLIGLILATDTALSLWQRLRELSPWLARLYLALLAALGLASAWLAWRILRSRPSQRPAQAARPQRAHIEQQTAALEQQGVDTHAVRQELALLDQRQAQPDLYLALFGEISSGKSSLINALLPGAQQSTSVLGGTTREAHYFRWPEAATDTTGEANAASALRPNQALLSGPIQLIDLPGFAEAHARPGELIDGLNSADSGALREAARAHVVIYVCDGDLNRTQFHHVLRLLALGKPLIIALNKIDRYQADELEQIQHRLESYFSALPDTNEPLPPWRLVAVHSGGSETLRVIDTHGQEHWQQRPRPAQVESLVTAIRQLSAQHHTQLRQRQHDSALMLAAEQVEHSTRAQRQQQAEEIVQSYARRAVAGALAAVAPGADLIIQGALATALVHALCQLYQAPVRALDIDRFLGQASVKLKRNTAVILAVAGNALKAFPGLGTVAGGLVHALAYGMIFHSLGRALASALADATHSPSAGATQPALPWQSQAGMAQFEEHWLGHLETPAKYLVRTALEQFQNRRPSPPPGGTP